jgi:hypothetical protein
MLDYQLFKHLQPYRSQFPLDKMGTRIGQIKRIFGDCFLQKT